VVGGGHRVSERRDTHGLICYGPQPTEAENCEVNGAMARIVLEAMVRARWTTAPRRARTGLKHYQGRFERTRKGASGDAVSARSCPDSTPELLLDQEDILFGRTARRLHLVGATAPHDGVGWRWNAYELGWVTWGLWLDMPRARTALSSYQESPGSKRAITESRTPRCWQST